MCPTVQYLNPTVLAISQSQDNYRYPRHVPSVPLHSARTPLSFLPECYHPTVLGFSETYPKCPTVQSCIPLPFPFHSLRITMSLMSHVSHYTVPESHCPSHPTITRDILDMSLVPHCTVPESHCPSHPTVPGLLGTSWTCP